MTSTGVVGGRWRATVTAWGAVEPWDGSTTIDWFVAADDRWHRPQHETSTRQATLDGTPVVETRVRIPGGDAVQRVYSVADAGGLTIIEVTNESTLPIAVAFTGGGLLSRRPPTSMPPQGIDLPADAVIYPIGHQAVVAVARAHGGVASDALPEGVAVSRSGRPRLARPDTAGQPVAAARPGARRGGHRGALRVAAQRSVRGRFRRIDDIDPATFLLGVAELVRLGDRPSIWVPDVAEQLERWARSGTAYSARIAGRMSAAAVEAAARVLHAAGEHRAVDDLRRMNLPRR